jgi:hypothetical protein
MSAYNYCMMFSYLWSLRTGMKSAQLHDVCLPAWWLLYWCLLICIISSYQNDDWSSVWCLPTCMYVLPVLCLPICIIFAQLYNVCLPVWSYFFLVWEKKIFLGGGWGGGWNPYSPPLHVFLFTNDTKQNFACFQFAEFIRNKIFLVLPFPETIWNKISHVFCFAKHAKFGNPHSFCIIALYRETLTPLASPAIGQSYIC